MEISIGIDEYRKNLSYKKKRFKNITKILRIGQNVVRLCEKNSKMHWMNYRREDYINRSLTSKRKNLFELSCVLLSSEPTKFDTFDSNLPAQVEQNICKVLRRRRVAHLVISHGRLDQWI